MTELERLRREWYRKDRAAGGQDLESIENPDGMLSDRGVPDFVKPRSHIGRAEYDTLAAYYRAASSYAGERPWKAPIDRRIWELHADGCGERRILATLHSEGHEISKGAHGREIIRRVIDQVRAELLGARRRVGRPRKAGGCGMDAKILSVRLDDSSVAALQALCERLQVDESVAVRTALLFAVRTGI